MGYINRKRASKKGVLMIIRTRRLPAGRRAAALLGLALWMTASSLALAEDKSPPSIQVPLSLKLSAFAQFQYTHDGSADTLTISRTRFSLEGQITKSIRYKFQADAAKSPVLLDAMIDLSLFNQGLLRLGQFKVPFSQESLTAASDHDTISLPRSVLSFSPGRDINASGRDIGAYILVRTSRLDLYAGLFNGAGINKADTNKEKDLAGRVLVTPLQALKVGASGYLGHYSAQAGQPAICRDRVGLEMALNTSGLTLRGEYILAKDGLVSSRGGYAILGYSFVPDKLQGVVRFDSLDQKSASSPGRNETWTLGLNWFFAAKTKFQVNLEFNRDEESSKGKTTTLLALLQAGF
jgi:phosphate-selective porin OprO/OprP